MMYKLEMHLHTLGRSPCAKVDEKTIAKLYADNGYNGIVCTNHYIRHLCEDYYRKGSPQANLQFWLDGYRTLKDKCAAYDIDVFLGMELCIDELTYYKLTPPHAEMLLYGITEEQLAADPYALFGMTLRELHSVSVENGWILAQSHPFRDGIDLCDPRLLEGAEFYNGHPTQNNHNDQAQRFVRDNNLIATAGSDFHFVGAEGSGVYLQNAVHDNNQLVAELRKRQHVPFCKDDTITV